MQFSWGNQYYFKHDSKIYKTEEACRCARQERDIRLTANTNTEITLRKKSTKVIWMMIVSVEKTSAVAVFQIAKILSCLCGYIIDKNT